MQYKHHYSYLKHSVYIYFDYLSDFVTREAHVHQLLIRTLVELGLVRRSAAATRRLSPYETNENQSNTSRCNDHTAHDRR